MPGIIRPAHELLQSLEPFAKALDLAHDEEVKVEVKNTLATVTDMRTSLITTIELCYPQNNCSVGEGMVKGDIKPYFQSPASILYSL